MKEKKATEREEVPRKVFISFLGTSSYKECRYKLEGEPSKPVKFVQEAIIKELCSNWTVNDRIFIFCTSMESTGKNGSKEKNWIDKQNTDGSIEIGLHSRLAKLLAELKVKTPIEEVDIKSGFTDPDIWEMFTTVYDKLQIGDTIFFDATHAFRSIPLFSIAMFNYSRFMIGTHLEKIMYGAFEALGPINEVDKIPIENRIAPIIDMSNIARLQEYNQVASEMVTFGRVRSISDSIYYKNNEASDDLCDLCEAIAELDEYIAIIQLENIRRGYYVMRFKASLKRLRESGEIASPNHPISRILDRLEEEMKSFVPYDSIKNIEAAIDWANRHEMVLQEYPLAEEYIIYRVIQIVYEEEMDDLEYKDQRELISSLLSMPRTKFNNNSYDRGIPKEYPELTRRIKENNRALITKLRESQYSELRLRRNSLAHAYGIYDYETLKESFYALYLSCKDIIDFYDYQ